MVGMFNPFSIDESSLTVSPDMSRELDPKKWLKVRTQKALMDKELIRLGGRVEVGSFQFDVGDLDGFSKKLLKEHYEGVGWFVISHGNAMSLIREAGVLAQGSEYGWENEPAVVEFYDSELLIEVAKDDFTLRISRDKVEIEDKGIIVEPHPHRDNPKHTAAWFTVMFHPPEDYMIQPDPEEETPDGDREGESQD